MKVKAPKGYHFMKKKGKFKLMKNPRGGYFDYGTIDINYCKSFSIYKDILQNSIFLSRLYMIMNLYRSLLFLINTFNNNK